MMGNSTGDNLARLSKPSDWGIWRGYCSGSTVFWLQQYVFHLASELSFTTVIAVSTIVGLFYYYFYLPMDWSKDLSGVGYDHLMEGRTYGKSKRELVTELRKSRKIGNLPPVYPNGWFGLAESADIAPGQVKHINALGENFAVFRTEKGACHVLDAYCPHLGANMGIGGKVHGDCLECPFHGWQFQGHDGKCSQVPYSNKVPSFSRVKHWKSCEVNQFIFVWYHAEGEDPTWQPQPIPQIQDGSWWYRGRNQFIVNSHIQEIPENGADVAHLNAIHAPSMLAGSDLRLYEKAWLSFARHNWSASWQAHKQPGEEHIGTMNLRHDLKLFGKFTIISMDVQAQQIGPGYVELIINTTFGPIAILQVVTPIEPLLQRIVHRLFCPPLLIPYAYIVLIGESIMIERDIMVWNHKMYVDKPLLLKEDRTIHLHRLWYSQFYTENSPRFSFQKNDMYW